MLTLRKACLPALLAGLVLVTGCGPKEVSVIFTNETAGDLDVAVVGPASIRPFPPIQRLPKGKFVEFQIRIDSRDMPATLTWKAGNHEGALLFVRGEKPESPVRILPAMKVVRKKPEDKAFDACVTSALSEFKTVQGAMQEAGVVNWKSITDCWVKALASGKAAEKALKARGGLRPDSDLDFRQQNRLAKNLVWTVAEAFWQIGQRYETGKHGAKADIPAAACYYVKSYRLGSRRAGELIAALKRRTEARFLRIFRDSLGSRQVIRHDGKRLYFEHKFVLLALQEDGLHYKIQVKYEKTVEHVVGNVPYTRDLNLFGSSIDFGRLVLKSNPTMEWPKDLKALWETLGILRGLRSLDLVFAGEA